MRKRYKLNILLNGLRKVCTIGFPLITTSYAIQTLQADYYGKFVVSKSIMNYLLLIAGLGISTYGIRNGARCRNDREKMSEFASELLSINIFSATGTILLMLLIILFWWGEYGFKLLLFVQSISIVLSAIGLEWVNVVYEDYLYLTVRYIVIQLIALIAMLLFVHNPHDYIKYAFISTLSSYGGNILNFLYLKKYISCHLVFQRKVLKHLPAILLFFFNSIATIIYVNSDITMIGFLYSNQEAGIYDIAVKIYVAIKGIGNSMLIVFLPQLSVFAHNKESERFQEVISKVFFFLLSAMISLAIYLQFFSGDIVSILTGTHYTSGISALRILAVSAIFAEMADLYMNNVLLPYGEEKKMVVITASSAALNIVLNYILIPRFGGLAAAGTTLISEFLIFILGMYASRHFYKPMRHVKNVVMIVEIGIISALICQVLYSRLESGALRIILAAGCCFITYIGIIRWNKGYFRSQNL